MRDGKETDSVKKNENYNETTSRLSEILSGVSSSADGEKFIENHSGTAVNFSRYLNDYIEKTGISATEVLRASQISRDYVYQIRNGRRKPSRDKAMALLIAAGMSYNEINRGLEMCGHRPFYPKDERDARIAIAVNTGIRNIVDINIMLDGYGLDPIIV